MFATSIEPDPDLRPPIWEIHVNKRNEIRRAYYNVGPCQPLLKLKKYPLFGSGRRFKSSCSALCYGAEVTTTPLMFDSALCYGAEVTTTPLMFDGGAESRPSRED
ncbi:GTP-binding nuclear protein Ran-A1 [Corchorus olitorius]|uniref:GTP-binding nuclear protein Ran-A1 n=1 Tax=Corchorus olitorius TaxID=93759 RepID=A0A1R3L470_9ROSI|nr:GTP-binding nuclear protein Ran-A1 [Corchorus olitorius]